MGECELASRYHYPAKTILVQSEGNTWAEDSLIITPACQQAGYCSCSLAGSATDLQPVLALHTPLLRSELERISCSL